MHAQTYVARVPHHQPVRDRSVLLLVGPAMGENALSADLHASVGQAAMGHDLTEPEQARSIPGHLLHESDDRFDVSADTPAEGIAVPPEPPIVCVAEAQGNDQDRAMTVGYVAPLVHKAILGCRHG